MNVRGIIHGGIEKGRPCRLLAVMKSVQDLPAVHLTVSGYNICHKNQILKQKSHFII